MDSIPQSPTKMRPRTRDTGFPEPFCGKGNTTLPHPEANLSPNASIDADDISVQHLLSRQRRSFLARNKRTISSGYITPAEMERVRATGEGALSPDARDTSAVSTSQMHQYKPGHHSRPSKDAAISITSSDGSMAGDDHPLTSSMSHAQLSGMAETRHDSGSERRRRRSSLLRWWQH